MNSIAALDAGATRLHGAALGIGERVGNTPMDLLLVNLVLMGYIERDLHAARTTTAGRWPRRATVPIPDNYPVIGRDAFRTATGVHAAAVVKAWRKGDRALMDAVYSAVPASLVGREQEIDVGPMSGQVERDLLARDAAASSPTEPLGRRVFRRAKASADGARPRQEILAVVYQ